MWSGAPPSHPPPRRQLRSTFFWSHPPPPRKKSWLRAWVSKQILRIKPYFALKSHHMSAIRLKEFPSGNPCITITRLIKDVACLKERKLAWWKLWEEVTGFVGMVILTCPNGGTSTLLVSNFFSLSITWPSHYKRRVPILMNDCMKQHPYISPVMTAGNAETCPSRCKIIPQLVCLVDETTLLISLYKDRERKTTVNSSLAVQFNRHPTCCAP